MVDDKKTSFSEAFKDLEDLLYQGFVVSPVTVGGVSVIMKSLSPAEVKLATYMAQTISEVNAVEFRVHLIAASIFILDGQVILSNRQESLPEVKQVIRELPEQVTAAFLRRISHLTDRSNHCLSQVEGYTYHPSARQRWLSYSGVHLNSQMITGIPGTEGLGMNYSQLLWSALNRLEDHRLAHESEWENAKYVASAWNSKGVSQTDQKDKARRRHLEDERKKLYQEASGEIQREDDGTVKVAAETTEQLIEQLNRTMTGEKDIHDLVVEKHEQMVRDEHENKLQQYQDWRDKQEDFNGFVEQNIERGITPGEVSSRTRAARQRIMRQTRAEHAASPPGELSEARQVEMMQRFGDTQSTPLLQNRYGERMLAELTEPMSPDEAAERVHGDRVDRKIIFDEGS